MNRQIRILIAEDEPRSLRLLRRLVGAVQDCAVVGEATNGVAAIDLYKELLPDIVIMDIAMPLMDGIEATRGIRRTNAAARILVASGHCEPDLVSAIFKAGAGGFLSKPIQLAVLADAITAMMRGDLYASEEVRDAIVSRSDAKLWLKLTPSEPLTRREDEVIRLVCEGRSTKDAALTLGIGVRTAETHRQSAMRKLGVSRISQIFTDPYQPPPPFASP